MMEKIYKLLMVGLININKLIIIKLQFNKPTVKWVVHRQLGIDK